MFSYSIYMDHSIGLHMKVFPRKTIYTKCQILLVGFGLSGSVNQSENLTASTYPQTLIIAWQDLLDMCIFNVLYVKGHIQLTSSYYT